MSDRKVLMMDAGTALFEMEGGFGTALGQVKAELREFGRVSEDGEDLVLTLPGIWNERRVICHLEGAGDEGELHKYAAVFKEGSRNSLLGNIVHGTCAVVLAAALVLPRFLFPEAACFALSAACTAGLLATAYSWVRPDMVPADTVRKLIVKLSGLK